MVIIKIDGVSIQLEAPDINGNGVSGDVEKIPQTWDKGTTPVIQPTELEGSLKELNKDEIDTLTRMSAIDMRTRLHPLEISSVLAIDSLVALGVLPQRCLPLSTQKKRLNVSQDGKGRTEMVELVAGKKEQDVKLGTAQKFKEGLSSFMGLKR